MQKIDGKHTIIKCVYVFFPIHISEKGTTT